ncbi:MAG: glycine--tRNA ligase subunit beta [Parerythrobacter sp.]
MTDFLLELRSEEIPARMQAGARKELEKLFRREMDVAGVRHGELTVWSTPRRLALIARDLPDATQAVSEEIKGPPETAPDKAVEGFCRKNGLTRDRLEVRDVKGRPTLFAVLDTPGRAVVNVLADTIPAIIRDFQWPKSMRWGGASMSTESLRWVRPLSGIVALFGDAIVECEAHGVTSGAVTLGHRFHHSGDITIGGAADYAMKLRAGHVIVDHEERAGIIRDGAAKAARDAGLMLVEDEGLVVENAGLTEWPVPLLGRFDAAFLDVPPEVIQLTARVNQKYFVCEDDGRLTNAFICTANIEAADGGAAIVEGNRKVLAARLADARFFWEQDRKKTLAEHAEGLARITFHEKLGTVADKVERVARLARWLCEEGIVAEASLQSGTTHNSVRPELVEGSSFTLGAASKEKGNASTGSARTVAELADQAEQAARLCKADLVTEMVGEFPELQGLMGGYYARAEGLPDAVSDAIRDHYKPVGQGDEVPTAPVTVAVSLADKLDTLVGFFAIGEQPTGSKDPFALRRAAISIIRIITSNKLRYRLNDIIYEASNNFLYQSANENRLYRQFDNHASDTYNTKWPSAKEQQDVGVWFRFLDISVNMLDGDQYHKFEELPVSYKGLIEWLGYTDIENNIAPFFADRLKVQQREAGVRHDLIDAVFALGGADDLVRLLARVHALQAFVETADGTNLLAGYKRAANILKKEGFDADAASADNSLSYMPEVAEKALIDALDAATPQAKAAVASEDFAAAMTALASLRAPIDAFFEEVTVNDDDEDKRAARLALLARFRDAVHRVADFSKIEG